MMDERFPRWRMTCRQEPLFVVYSTTTTSDTKGKALTYIPQKKRTLLTRLRVALNEIPDGAFEDCPPAF
eukprot:scaffold4050_cov55-Cylindrotheca_fusiformis.AAC.1